MRLKLIHPCSALMIAVDVASGPGLPLLLNEFPLCGPLVLEYLGPTPSIEFSPFDFHKLPIFLQIPMCVLSRFYQGFEKIRKELPFHFSGKHIVSVENQMFLFLKSMLFMS